MNSQQAKELLGIYRPGIDEYTPEIAEALALAQADPELRRWLDEELARREAIRRKFTGIEPPPGLAAAIIQRRAARMRHKFAPKRILAMAAAVALFAGLALFWRHIHEENQQTYEQYLGQVISNYKMSLETGDLDKIRTFLTNNQAPADYVLPPPLQQTQALGCATMSWNGNPVSMLCFKDQAQRKLFLFVVDQQAVQDAPVGASPRVSQSGEFSSAIWKKSGKIYVLAVQGPGDLLKDYF